MAMGKARSNSCFIEYLFDHLPSSRDRGQVLGQGSVNLVKRWRASSNGW